MKNIHIDFTALPLQHLMLLYAASIQYHDDAAIVTTQALAAEIQKRCMPSAIAQTGWTVQSTFERYE